MTARKYDPVCSYPGCDRPHNSKGLCSAHGLMQRSGVELRPIQARTGPIRKPAAERFEAKVRAQPDGCMVWTGGKTYGGYGSFAADTTPGAERREMAHRWSYEHYVGQIPVGFDIDHLCRNRACVNPAHLEPVTRQENIRRSAALRTDCPAGHTYDDENTARNEHGHRRCRTCMRLRDRDRRPAKNERRRAAYAKAKQAQKEI